MNRLAAVRELHDGLLNQWVSKVHRCERVRMLTYLFGLGRDLHSAVMVVPGTCTWRRTGWCSRRIRGRCTRGMG